MRNTYGYVRVSSQDQNEARQLIALREKQVDCKRIYIDKQSGKDFNRPQYKRMLKIIKPVICCIFSALIDVEETTRRYSANGVY